MDDIKIPNLSEELQEPYKDLMQDLNWTIGEISSFDYEVEIDEVEDDYAQLIVYISDDIKDSKDKGYRLHFRIYADPKKSTTINRWEDVWEDENREIIWMMLFFQADSKAD